MCLNDVLGDAARVLRIFEDSAVAYLWFAAIIAGVIAMFVADDARVFIIFWAASGIAAVVVADVKTRRRSPER
jgi:hypothetical protein